MSRSSGWNKLQPVVPVHKDTGNMLSYPERNTEMTRVYDFESEMKLVDWERGMSSVTFILEDTEGHQYPIFVSEFYWVVRNCSITNGVIEKTRWTFAKQGKNYSIKLL